MQRAGRERAAHAVRLTAARAVCQGAPEYGVQNDERSKGVLNALVGCRGLVSFGTLPSGCYQVIM